MRKTGTITLLILITLIGCKEDFLLNSSNYTGNLVVEGTITNEPGPYQVILSQSSSISNYKNIPVTNCTVKIQDDTGNSEILTELEQGLYSTDKNGIQGEIGKSYQLLIITPAGKEYSSDFQELKAPVEISEVKAELFYEKNQEFPDGLPGYQFYISTEEASDDSYFLWRMEETYEYIVDFDLWDIYFGILQLDTNKAVRDIIVQKYRSELHNCWKTNSVNYVNTGKTSNLTIPKITKQPLLFIGTDTKRLQKRYSLLIKQFVINKDAYYFWKNIEDQSSSENFLIVTQPYNIKGNIRNLNDPDENVSGYFTVGSVTQERIFVDRPNEPFHYDVCNLVTDPGMIKYLFDKGKPPFYLIEYDNSYGFAILKYEYCVDCTLNEAQNIEPDFWINK